MHVQEQLPLTHASLRQGWLAWGILPPMKNLYMPKEKIKERNTWNFQPAYRQSTRSSTGKLTKKKQKVIKENLTRLQKKLLKDHKKQILGITLLPPKKEEKDKINVLVVLDDSKAKIIPDFKMKDKVTPELIAIAKRHDEKVFLEVMLVFVFSCFCFFRPEPPIPSIIQ